MLPHHPRACGLNCVEDYLEGGDEEDDAYPAFARQHTAAHLAVLAAGLPDRPLARPPVTNIPFGFGDKLNLRPMLVTPGWNSDLASIGHALIQFDLGSAAGGTTQMVTKLKDAASVSLDTLRAHLIT